MNFIKSIAPHAVKYMKSEGILASLTLAQAVLESDSGKSELAIKANNLFGIKASSPWNGPKYEKKTKEFSNGEWIEIIASFCHFKSLEECIEYRSSTFLKKPRYAKLWGITDYKEACQIIYECGYATDPNYPKKLIDVIEKYNLHEFDKEEDKMVKVFIDPGHGGTDPGAVGNGLQEKDLTLTISKKMKDILSDYENVEVKLSRDKDETLSLKARTDAANKWGADYVVSVHINAGGGMGYEDFIYTTTSAKTIANQNVMHQEIIKQIDFKDRGKKRKNLHMVREAKASAILTESGFIDNLGDANKLKQDSYLNKIALGHANGIASIFGLKKKATPQVKASTVEGVMYRVVTGSFKDKANAEQRVKELKAKGFDSFIDAVKI